jgi:hypothetical protein
MPLLENHGDSSMIEFANAKTELVRDSHGRAFNWTLLRRKTIYLTGHGQHTFRDGYCTIPTGTTLHFYQTYGRLLIGDKLPAFLRGEEKWEAERTFRAGQSCPNMTLLQDDNNCVEYTEKAIGDRLAREQDAYSHFNFNCNQFSGLSRYVPIQRKLLPGQEAPGPNRFSGRPMLKLQQILELTRGNTLHWCCCQDIADQLSVAKKMAEKQFGHSALPMGSAEFLLLYPLDCFSKTVQDALLAAREVSSKIQDGYNSPGDFKLGDKHRDGTYIPTIKGSSMPYETSTLTRNKGPAFGGTAAVYIASLRAPAGMGPSTLVKARTGIQVQSDREMAQQAREKIKAGIWAIQNEPQQDPFKTPKALAFLERNLIRAENLSRALGAMR